MGREGGGITTPQEGGYSVGRKEGRMERKEGRKEGWERREGRVEG